MWIAILNVNGLVPSILLASWQNGLRILFSHVSSSSLIFLSILLVFSSGVLTASDQHAKDLLGLIETKLNSFPNDICLSSYHKILMLLLQCMFNGSLYTLMQVSKFIH